MIFSYSRVANLPFLSITLSDSNQVFNKNILKGLCVLVNYQIFNIRFDYYNCLFCQNIIAKVDLSENNQMRKILFPLQKLAMVFFYFELLMDLDKTTYAICSLVLIGLSLYFEGARVYTPLLILVVLLEMFQFNIPQVFIVIAIGVAAAALKIYDIDVPIKGPYLVGHHYKELKGQHGNFLLSVFYPTMTKTAPAQWIPKQKDYNKVLYEIFHVDPKARRIPYQLFRFIVSYIHRIYMPAYRNPPYINKSQTFNQDSKYSQNQQKIIVFSHGLGSHLNANSSMACSWASQGYTVVSVNHDNDVVCLDHRPISEDHQVIREFLHKNRNRDLNIRVKQMTQAVDMVLNQNFMKQEFGVSIPIKQVILAGHSYGGGTAIATKAHLNTALAPQKLSSISRILCLDPWLFPLAEQTYSVLKNQPILIINSEYFYQQVPYIYYLQKLFCKLKAGSPQLQAFMVQKMDHIAQCDMAYVFGNILQITGSIKLQSLSDQFMALNLIICNLFLEGKSKAEVLEIANKFVENKRMDMRRVLVREQYRTNKNLTFGRSQTEDQSQIQNKL